MYRVGVDLNHCCRVTITFVIVYSIYGADNNYLLHFGHPPTISSDIFPGSLPFSLVGAFCLFSVFGYDDDEVLAAWIVSFVVLLTETTSFTKNATR